MLKENIRVYYLTRDYNCAETVLRVLNEEYGLNLKEEDFRLVSGFGGGCGCGIICGALAGAISALGAMMVTDRAHTTASFKDYCGEFCKRFAQTVGSTSCCEIRPKYFREDTRCVDVIAASVACFGEFVREKGLVQE